jgi:hypothetical protein
MNYHGHKPGCRHDTPQTSGLFGLASNLLQLSYSLAWAGARGGRALLERAVWMDHSPGCASGGHGCEHACDCCCRIECLPPVYAGCCRTGCGRC